MRVLRIVFIAILLSLSACRSAAPPRPTNIAPGLDLVRGTFVPGTQPDGNSVIFSGSEGLIVVDTGRHESHTRKIVDLARAQGRPIAAVINTHWHLDHIGRNALLRREYPGLRIYASGALEGAMQGFLASYRKQLEEMIAKTSDVEAQKPFRGDLAIIDSGRALFPDETITTSGSRTIAGRTFDVQLETNAVTGGDVWLIDRETGIIVAGDLVTIPAPFLDTACPSRWSEALDRLASREFEMLVPGHGPVMSKAGFLAYRNAFRQLLSCAASNGTKDACVNGWVNDAATLLAAEDEKFTRALMSYYVDLLRGDPIRISKLCGSP